MHELSIAGDLAEIVLNEARKASLSKVTRICICFGELVQIVPDIFKFAFTETIRNSIADGSELDIEILRIRIKCRMCGNESPVNDHDFTCRICHSDKTDLVSGNEMYVKYIEGD